MQRTKRGLVLSGLAALLLVLLVTCTLTPRVPTATLRLVVGYVPRMVSVTTMDVDRLEIAVYPPGGGDSIDEFEWYDGDPVMERNIPIHDAGTYELFVTHVGNDGFEDFYVTEYAEVPISPGIMSVVAIQPGSVGGIVIVEGEEPPLGPPVQPLDCGMVAGMWGGPMSSPGMEGGWIDYYGELELLPPDPEFMDGPMRMHAFDPVTGDPLEYPTFQGYWRCEEGIIRGTWTHSWSEYFQDWVEVEWGEIYWEAGGVIDGTTWYGEVDTEGPWGHGPDGHVDAWFTLERLF